MDKKSNEEEDPDNKQANLQDPDDEIELDDEEDQEEGNISRQQRVGDTVFYQCTKCPLMSLSREAVDNHWNQEHRPEALLCPGCGQAFPSQPLLKSHLARHHKMTKAHSDTLVKNLLKELIVKQKSPEIQKNLIPLDLSTNLPENTQTEIEIIDLVDVDVDERRNGDRSKKKNLSLIVKNLHGVSNESSFDSRGFKCGIRECNVRLKDLDKLKYHRTCHIDGEKNLACPECSRPFLTSISLHAHLWLDHKVDLELYSCDRCDYKTPSLSSLESVHKKTHLIDKNHSCSVCRKSFKSAKQLENHKSTHKNDREVKKFVCEICNSSLSTRSKLLRHVEAVHRKLKPFSCKICSYSAANNWSLRIHMRTHSGDESYECTECSFTTSLSESLKRHLQTHSDEKRYSCKLCSYTCIQTSTLKNHIKSKHPNVKSSIIYSCEHCKFTSINKTKYLTHVSTHAENSKTEESPEIKENNATVDQQTYKIALTDHDKLIDKSIVPDLLNFRNPFDYTITRTEALSTPDNCEIQSGNICNEVYSSNQSLNSDTTAYSEKDITESLFNNREYIINPPQSVDNILNKVLLRPASYESETTNISEPQHSSSPIIIDGDSIRLNSPNQHSISMNCNFISSKSSSPLLPLTLPHSNNVSSDQGMVRKKPKISVKSNLLLKSPDNLNPFHQQLTCKAITSLLSLRNQTSLKDSSIIQCDKSGSLNLTVKPTNELTNQDSSNTFLQNGTMILPNFPFSSNYSFGDEPLLDDISLANNIESPFIPNESMENPNNMIPGLIIPSENKPYMNGQYILSNELPDIRIPVQIPMKFEDKMHSIPQQSIQDYFFDNINENLTAIEELPPSFENPILENTIQMYDGFDSGEVSSDAGDERKIIILDENSSDIKSNLESKAGFGFENKVFYPTTSNPWKQNLMLPSFIRLSNQIDINSSHNNQGINYTPDQMTVEQYENQSYGEVFSS